MAEEETLFLSHSFMQSGDHDSSLIVMTENPLLVIYNPSNARPRLCMQIQATALVKHAKVLLCSNSAFVAFKVCDSKQNNSDVHRKIHIIFHIIGKGAAQRDTDLI